MSGVGNGPYGAAISLALAVILSLIALFPTASLGQCILVNPSFEVGGSGGEVHGGWNQFGSVGSSSNATHGSVAVKLTGPNLGGWDTAGVWQRMGDAFFGLLPVDSQM